MSRWVVFFVFIMVASGCATITIPRPSAAPSPGEDFKPISISTPITNVPPLPQTNDIKKPDPGWVLDEFYVSGNSAVFIWRHVKTGHRYICSGFGGVVMVLE